MNMEATAVNLIQRGIKLDSSKRFTEALICYQEGIQILVDLMKDTYGDRKVYLRMKIDEYITRAENIKANISKLTQINKYHEQLHIENDSTGHSYESILGRFLDESVKFVKVEDPYIRIYHQCQNLVRFTELIVRKCKKLEKIILITSKDDSTDQQKWLGDISLDLLNYGVVLEIIYSNTLHDRQIILSSGWIIKIGRGLDYFKAPDNRFSLGTFDLELRKCHETIVDIFHSKDVVKKTI